MPSDANVLYELDLGEPPQQLLDWAKENIRENPDTRCLILEDFRDIIYSRGECTPHRTDDAFLLRFLRGRNFNIESAYRLCLALSAIIISDDIRSDVTIFEVKQKQCKRPKNRFIENEEELKVCLNLVKCHEKGANGAIVTEENGQRYLLADQMALTLSSKKHHAFKRKKKYFVNYYEFKENNPEIFEGVHLRSLLRIGCAEIITVPPYREQTGRRILLYRMGKWDTEKYSVAEILQATLAILEIAILEPRAQILGGIGMFDMSNLTLNQAYQMTPSIAHKIFQIMVTSFPMKIHAVHVVFQPWIFDIVFGMFKPFLNNTMKDKIFFHGEDMESLHKHIDPKHLPERYGGRHQDYDYAEWIDGFKKSDKIKNELVIQGYGIDESEYEDYRSDSEKSESSCSSD